jgi:hypothetical protein
MNTNLNFEIILLLFAILTSNGIIYSFTLFNLKKENSSENLTFIINKNSSEKALTFLIGSNPMRLTSLESSSSDTLSVISSESSSSTLVNSSSSEANISSDTFINENLIELDMYEEIMTQTQHSV